MRRSEAGLSLVETLVALALIGFALLVTATVVAWGERTEGRLERRAVALDVAASVLEELRQAPPASVRARVDSLADRVAGSVLPDGESEVFVERDDERGLRRVTVEVRWGGREPGRLRLATDIGDAGIYR